MGTKPQPDLFFLGKSTLGSWSPLDRHDGHSRRAMAWVLWVALPLAWAALRFISHWWHHKVIGVLVCLLPQEIFWQIVVCLQVWSRCFKYTKVFCSLMFLMCRRNLLIFRLLVAESSPYHFMDGTGGKNREVVALIQN